MYGNDRTPLFVIWVLASMLFAPIWFVLSFGIGPLAFSSLGPLQKAIVIGAYWICPLSIAVSMWFRSALSLPLIAIEFLLVALHALEGLRGDAITLSIIRLCLSVFAVVVGAFIGNRELILPYLLRRAGGWRKARRIQSSIPAHLVTADRQRRIMIEDFSYHGAAIALAADDTSRQFIDGLRSEQPKILFSVIDGVREVPVEIIWQRDVGPFLRLGIRAIQGHEFSALLKTSAAKRQHSRLASALQAYWAMSSVRRTANAAWIISVAGALGVPACGELSDHRSTRLGGDGGSERAITDEPPAGGTRSLYLAPNSSPAPSVVDDVTSLPTGSARPTTWCALPGNTISCLTPNECNAMDGSPTTQACGTWTPMPHAAPAQPQTAPSTPDP